VRKFGWREVFSVVLIVLFAAFAGVAIYVWAIGGVAP
jgi:hypothetical protein